MAFGNEIKTGNIKENWLFQLGFYNGDSQGNGEGGTSPAKQNNGNLNLLGASVATNAGSLNVDDETVFSVGDYIKVDNEIFRITSIPAGNTLVVARGAFGTTIATHSNNAQIYWHNFVPISFADVTFQGVFYYGSVLNKPSIRESINLQNSTAKTSNISINIPDFIYQGKLISELLWGGTKSFINQIITIYSKVNQQANSNTAVNIGSFRLVSLSTDGNTITLSATSHRPWDFISFPQQQHPKSNIYEPVVYGSYDYSDATNGATNNASYSGVFPVPVLYTNRNIITTIMPRSYSSNSHCYLHHDVGYNYFCSMKRKGYSAVDTTSVQDGVNILETPTFHRATGWIRTNQSSFDFDGNVVYLTNPEKATDYVLTNGEADTSTYATADINNINDTRFLTVQTPNKKFEVTIINGLIIKHSIQWDNGSGDAQKYNIDCFSNLYDSTDDDLLTSPSVRYLSSNISTHTETFNTTPANAVASEQALVCPDELLIKWIALNATGYVHEDHELRVYDIQLSYENRFDRGDDDRKRLADVKYFYCGANGLQHGITGLATNEITEIHEAHLDLLNRFAGLDVNTNPATNIIGWGNGSNDGLLDHAKDWKIRYWQLEPINLKKQLEKLQYEGGFIFKFKKGDLTKPQYIFIKDSYSSVDYTLSKKDLKNISVFPENYSSLITQMDINYKRHPSNNSHVVSVESKNNIARREYNVNPKENIKNVKLDTYISPEIPTTPSSNPNDDFYTYYNNINGDLKLIVKAELVNFDFYDLDVGDVVEFSNMYPKKAFGKNFVDLVFMVTSISRTVGSIKFEARQIADNN